MELKALVYQGEILLKPVARELARLEARVLLQHILKFSIEEIILKGDQEISDQDVQMYLTVITQRLNGVPLSKITGKREFYGRDFKVTTDVLDPRSDSEILIDTVLSHVPKTMGLKILELGVGSGCLILTLLKEYQYAQGVGVERSSEALEVAKENAKALGVEDRFSGICVDWALCDLGEKFDVVVSNPPYIPTDDLVALEPEVKDHDPREALDGGADGLVAYRSLGELIPSALKPGGLAFLEIGQGQEVAVTEIMETAGFRLKGWVPDLAGILRCGVFAL
jgi:release factor glutamine methyltransferase